MDRALSPDDTFDFAIVLPETPAGAHYLTLPTAVDHGDPADHADPADPAGAPVAVVAEGVRRKVQEKEEEAHPG